MSPTLRHVAWIACSLLSWNALGQTARSARPEADPPGQTPLVVPIGARVAPGSYRLVAPGTEPVPAQVFEDAGQRYLAVLWPSLTVPGEIQGRLQPAPTAIKGVELKATPETVQVWIEGALLTEYRAADGPKPYFYPVIGPTGEPITRAHPMQKVAGEDYDHNHQRSFWFTHGDVDGIDFWASDPLNAPKANYGSIKERSRPTLVSGPVVGVLRTTDDWLGPDGKKLCEDERVVRFYSTTAARVFDFEIVIRASERPVTFKDTKEGMFGFRVASSMDVKRKQGGKITNAEGITDNAAWGKASPWVDYTGPVNGKTVGLAILNHPSSFRYPTTWHVRDYGLFAANPFGWRDFGMNKSGDHTIPKGESITFRYRVVLHPGDTASAKLPEVFRAYAQTPTLRITE